MSAKIVHHKKNRRKGLTARENLLDNLGAKKTEEL